MKIKLPSFKRSPEKDRALALARQSAAFYDIAAAKGGMSVRGRNKNAADRRAQSKRDRGLMAAKPKEPRQKKARYIPGTLGVSVVSESIKADYGRVLSRRERKRLANKFAPFPVPFAPYYNGEAAKG